MNREKEGKTVRSLMLQVGNNMWDDFLVGPDDFAKSIEEEKINQNPFGPDPRGKRSRYHSYLCCDDGVWKDAVDSSAEKGMNAILIDLGEGVEFPSHPELAVKGTWSVEKMQKELARIRSLGLEPLPKLNFSACHDSWLKEYHRMLSTKEYYQVVADVIRDTVELFDNPRYFHIGYDEEFAMAQFNTFFCVMRQGDLWWHDLNYTVGQVSKHGVRPIMWADAIWTGREEFIRRASRDILMSNWYYRNDFSEKKQQWDHEFEKRGGWGETFNGLAGFLALENAGFDQLPCGSNWDCEENIGGLVKFCRERIDPGRLKGFLMAPWASTMPENRNKILRAIDLASAAF